MESGGFGFHSRRGTLIRLFGGSGAAKPVDIAGPENTPSRFPQCVVTLCVCVLEVLNPF